MSTASQLFQLQETEAEIETHEQALLKISRELKENSAVLLARVEFETARKQLDELRQSQQTLEIEIADLSAKIKAGENKLYGGAVGNPKELVSLQQDIENLKQRRAQLENRTMEIIVQVDLASATAETAGNALKEVESAWHTQGHKLTTEARHHKAALPALIQKQKTQSAAIPPESLSYYYALKKQRGRAVARVEQGLCCGCRISLPTILVKRARGNILVQCSSCGRILYLV
jgi:predicted  nucleic acid-binding Zn-ribbon protein